MKRLKDAWFEFNGVKCTEKKVRLMEMPERTRPAMRGESELVPGRHGDVWISEDAYDVFLINVSCATIGDDFSINDINAWLTGEGELRFSDESDIIYLARVEEPFMRSNRWLKFADQEFTVGFTCQPFRYKYVATESADDISITATNTPVTNPGTVFSEPMITIKGNGDCTFSINDQEVTFEGLSGGVVIDSELQDCISLDGSQLLNSKATMDEFPTLKPGLNNITYSGSIQSITIRPRWRYL